MTDSPETIFISVFSCFTNAHHASFFGKCVYIWRECAQIEVSTPATADLTPLTSALGVEQEVPSLTDKQLIQQLVEHGASSITVQNPVTNNLVWARPVAAGAMLTLPMRYQISRPADLLVDVNSRYD